MGVETVFNQLRRNDYNNSNEDVYLFGAIDQPKGMVQMVEILELSLQQAHRYVLLHLDDIDQYQG